MINELQKLPHFLKASLFSLNTQHRKEVCLFLPLLPDVCSQATIIGWRKTSPGHISVPWLVSPALLLYEQHTVPVPSRAVGTVAGKYEPKHL